MKEEAHSTGLSWHNKHCAVGPALCVCVYTVYWDCRATIRQSVGCTVFAAFCSRSKGACPKFSLMAIVRRLFRAATHFLAYNVKKYTCLILYPGGIHVCIAIINGVQFEKIIVVSAVATEIVTLSTSCALFARSVITFRIVRTWWTGSE